MAEKSIIETNPIFSRAAIATMSDATIQEYEKFVNRASSKFELLGHIKSKDWDKFKSFMLVLAKKRDDLVVKTFLLNDMMTSVDAEWFFGIVQSVPSKSALRLLEKYVDWNDSGDDGLGVATTFYDDLSELLAGEEDYEEYNPCPLIKDVINGLDYAEKLAFFSKPGFASVFATCTRQEDYILSEWLCQLIIFYSADQQMAIMRAMLLDYMTWLPHDCMSYVDDIPIASQIKALSQHNVVWAFLETGHKQWLMKILNKLPAKKVGSILYARGAIEGLAKHGEIGWVKQKLASLDEAMRQQIISIQQISDILASTVEKTDLKNETKKRSLFQK